MIATLTIQHATNAQINWTMSGREWRMRWLGLLKSGLEFLSRYECRMHEYFRQDLSSLSWVAESRRALFFRGGENLPDRRTCFIAKYLRSVLSPKSKCVDLLLLLLLLSKLLLHQSMKQPWRKELFLIPRVYECILRTLSFISKISDWLKK